MCEVVALLVVATFVRPPARAAVARGVARSLSRRARARAQRGRVRARVRVMCVCVRTVRTKVVHQ